MSTGKYAVFGRVTSKNKVIGLAAGRWFVRRLTAAEKQQVLYRKMFG